MLRALAATCLVALAPVSACAAPAPTADRAGSAAASAWARTVTPLGGDAGDHDGIVRAAANARFVLLGENTHGTREYYVERARISERLVREAGFGAVAIEGDWSATHRVN